MNQITPLLSPDCAAFFTHWKSLRKDGALLPTSEDFLDAANPKFAAATMIVDLTGEALIVRLAGTDLVRRWDHEITGETIHAAKPQAFRAKLVENVLRMLEHPCGCRLVNRYATNRQRSIRSESILLPLSAKNGRPPRIVMFSRELDPRDDGEDLTSEHETIEAGWMDIGAGLPAAPTDRPKWPGKK
jgi:hypothetical protein